MKNLPKLYVMVGSAGSGKSTYAKSHMKEIPYISRDEIRYSLLGAEDEYHSKEFQVHTLFIKSLAESLLEKGCVIADATNRTIKSRRKFIAQLERMVGQFEIHYICIEVPLSVCLFRNAQRVGRACCPVEAVTKMYHELVFPTYGENKRIAEIKFIKNF